MRKTWFILVVGLLALSSCQQRVVYSDFRTLPIEGWHEDSVLTFETDMQDSVGTYDVLIVVRHTNQYAYQNLWLFVESYTDLGISQRDTIEATLADDYGRWLGSGIGSLYTNLYYYKEEMHYAQVGTYTYIIEQAMREDELRGIANIGLQIIEKNGKE
jgi:gliding motility-associated lipoprotein GldH